MKVYVRKWQDDEEGRLVYVEVAILYITPWEGLSFRQLPEGVEPATSVCLRGVKVTEMYVKANEDALVVYVEEIEDDERKATI